MPLMFIMFVYAQQFMNEQKKRWSNYHKVGFAFHILHPRQLLFIHVSVIHNHCPSKSNRGNKMRTWDGIQYDQRKTVRKVQVVKWGQVQLQIWELRRVFMEEFE